MPERRALLEAWLAATLGGRDFRLEPASGDASFRRYWRVLRDGPTWIAMDAPPAQESIASYVDVTQRFRAVGLRTPEVFAGDPEQGFALVEDLGTRLYLDALREGDDADRLYADALAALALIQARVPPSGLPEYDGPFLRREMELFREWLLGGHLQLVLSGEEEDGLDRAFELLVASALEQPRVCVHRDYHSRNLLVTDPPSPGILDFQDAVQGPVTYDLVSLLRDCYIAWPARRVEQWAWGYFQLAVQSGILRAEHEAAFPRWLDLMGVQRHLKAAGIFARLHLRDGKSGYLPDIPRTLGYILEVAAAYPQLAALARLVGERVLPRVSAGQ